MSITTFIKSLYGKYVSPKPPAPEPVVVKTGPRVRTTHVTDTGITTTPKTKTTATAVTTPAPTQTQAAQKKTSPANKTPAKATTTPPGIDTPVAVPTATNTIYPIMLRATDNALTEQDLVSRKWLGDLLICYAFDTPQGPQPLQPKDIPVGMTIEKLHEKAVENLGKNIEYSLKETSFGGYELVAGGRYEASVICLPGIWQWLTEQFVDSLLVIIPAKDRVLVIPEQDNHNMGNLHTAVREAFKNSSKSLTANIFRFNRYSQQWSIVGNAQ